jgi:hypothetical protein
MCSRHDNVAFDGVAAPVRYPAAALDDPTSPRTDATIVATGNDTTAPTIINTKSSGMHDRAPSTTVTGSGVEDPGALSIGAPIGVAKESQATAPVVVASNQLRAFPPDDPPIQPTVITHNSYLYVASNAACLLLNMAYQTDPCIAY